MGSCPVAVQVVISRMGAGRPDMLCVKDKGPLQAARLLAGTLQDEEARKTWAEEARISAIVGTCPRSLREVRMRTASVLTTLRDVG